MAAVGDDESWLYGDEGKDDEGGDEKNDGVGGGEDESRMEEEEETTRDGMDIGSSQQNGDRQLGAPEEGGEEEDEDEESDDDIQITIDKDKIEAAKTSYQTMQLKKSGGGDYAQQKEKKGKFTVEEFDHIGTINGQPATEVDLESMEDKPWRKPGADITDYFNYGFTEETWAAYINRQKMLRTNESGSGLISGSTAIITTSKYTSSNIGISMGTIPTLGTDVKKTVVSSHPPPAATPKKPEEPSGIQVMTHDKRIYSQKVGGMDFSVPPPAFSVPPPGLPPPVLPPPVADFPPPSDLYREGGVPVDAAGPDFGAADPFGDDIYAGGYEPTAEAQWAVPPPGPWEQPPPHQQQHPPPDFAYSSSYRRRDSREDRYRDYDRDRRSARRGRSRSRSRERDRERDRSYRERDRDRERDRERESRERRIKKERRSRSRSKSKQKKSRKDRKERREGERTPEGGDRTPPLIKEEPADKEPAPAPPEPAV